MTLPHHRRLFRMRDLSDRKNPIWTHVRWILLLTAIALLSVSVGYWMNQQEQYASVVKDRDALLMCMNGQVMRSGDEVMRCSVQSTEIKLVGKS